MYGRATALSPLQEREVAFGYDSYPTQEALLEPASDNIEGPTDLAVPGGGSVTAGEAVVTLLQRGGHVSLHIGEGISRGFLEI